MCGIFGAIIDKSVVNVKQSVKLFEFLARVSQDRGKDSSGIAVKESTKLVVTVLKGALSIEDLVANELYKTMVSRSLETSQVGTLAIFGHARLVTNGSQLDDVNNQPVVKNDTVLVHNGIVTNGDSLWESHPFLERSYKIDTEIIPALIWNELNSGKQVASACNAAFKKLDGTYSVAIMFSNMDSFVLATNNGSLYYLTDDRSYLFFASERHFLASMVRLKEFQQNFAHATIKQLHPGDIFLTNTSNLFSQYIPKDRSTDVCGDDAAPYCESNKHKIEVHGISGTNSDREFVIDPSDFIDRSREQHLYDMLEHNAGEIRALNRCTKCILPETFPFIEFDEKGVCNYCSNYVPKNQSGTFDDLMALVEPYRSKSGKQDCIVPFSGGRDSTYSLHIIKRELGLNPIAFTYDWGMVTDLARRNIARVCGKLGVENIIVSADIKWKRENIRKNIEAWLKNPSLGMIPLFMAGDKYFFYYCDQVKKRTGIKLNIWGINYLENTEFKTGFAGLPPKFNKKHIYSLSIKNQFKLFSFVGSNILKSPGYINQSVFDSLGSFAVRYLAPKTDYYHLFDYYRWDENEINDLIMNEYHWETAIDTKSTWRIGDGTASFYNYIYYTVAGFSENDTFRSNQIREGMITREDALSLIEQDNLPRYETLRWYFEIVGIDYQKAIRTINSIPKLY